MTTRSTHRDPRNIIIPDAFEVSEELPGKPLVVPSRRLFALFNDLMVVGFFKRVPFAGAIAGLATEAMAASVDDLEEAEEAVSGLSEVADDLGIERDEMPGLVLAAVPDDGAENVADWQSAFF